MSTTDKIDRLIKDNLQQTASRQLDRRIDSLIAQSQTEPTQDSNVWRNCMQNKRTKLAFAAIVFLAVTLGVVFLPGGNSGKLFANVMDSVFTVDSVRYEWNISKKNWSHGYTCMINDLCVRRVDVHDGDTLMHDFKTGSQFQLFNGPKHAVLTSRIGRNQNKHPFGYLDWISKLHQNDAVYEGTEQLDGKTMNVYVNKLEFEETKIWVDPATDLPYKIVIESYPNNTASVKTPELQLSISDFGGEGGYTYSVSAHNKWAGIQDRQTQVFSDFEWNANLDDSLFAFKAPEGYTFEEKKVVADKNNNSRDLLVEALSFWTDMSEGRFPDDIAELVDQEKARTLLVEKYDEDGDPKAEMERAIEQMKTLVDAAMEVQELIAANNWNYNGTGHTYGDPDTPICWWQKETETGTGYEIIYGDLSKIFSEQSPLVD